MALKVVGSNPIIHPRKDTRLDTFFKSGISFLCWNDTRNRVLFQFFRILDLGVVWYRTGIVFGVAIGYHNAEITLESTPGKGTTITVQF